MKAFGSLLPYDMNSNPGFHLLVARGLSVAVGTGSQYRDKQRSLPHLTTGTVMDGDGPAGPVHEHLLAGLVLLAQNHVQLSDPALVQFAVPAIAISIRVRLAVLFPRQLQRQMRMTLQFIPQNREVRHWPSRLG